jgi:hypothetical protein
MSTDRSPSITTGDERLIATVGEHVETHFGPVARVYHELLSACVHVDLYIVDPTKERPVTTVVTCGMSRRPMRDNRSVELMLVLPPTWPTLGQPGFETHAGFWPYRLLKQLARFPHEHGTALWGGHTIPNGDPPLPYGPNTKLCGALIGPIVHADTEDAHTIRYRDRDINLFAVWLLHADELAFKHSHGAGELFDLLDSAGVSEIVHADRHSAAEPPRRRRRLFHRGW